MLNSKFSALGTPLPSRHAWIAGLTLLVVMALGVWQMVAASLHPGGLDFPRSWSDFRQGHMTQGFEKQLEKKLPWRQTLITAANSARYVLTGGAGDQVRVGRDDWLFLTEELKFDADGAAHLRARAELLAAATARLNRLGVKLVLALVPDKARLYGQNLKTRRYPPYNDARYADTLLALRERGVSVVDLLTPLSQRASQEEVYYRSDTHWNQRGAQVAAAAIALALQRLSLNFDVTAFASTTSNAPPVERPGDLVRLMGLETAPSALRPRQDWEAIVTTTQQSHADSAVGLLGDNSVPAVLTGTSFSMRGNFHGYLQQALQVKILNAAKDGGGFLQATTDYLKDDAFHSSKPQLIVWELPERFMWTPLTDEPQWLAKVGLRP